jgi:NAD(P)-dependent dehydrogenase (short-subunit alcohol dehydrogenase family)
MRDFAGKVALVTGGSSGIGLATARAFARRGATVVIAGRRRDAGELAAVSIATEGGVARFVPTDVAREDDVLSLLATIVAGHGRLDAACNCAGVVGPAAPLADVAEADFDAVVATNLKGVWLAMKHEIRQMLAQGGGAIVNVASANATHVATTGPVYSATKAAVVSLTKAAALSYVKAGVRINALNPGAFRTPLLEGIMDTAFASPEDGLARYEGLVPLGRLGRPAEAAEAVVWLCSDAASYVTGAVLAVDGGLAAR